MRAAHRKVVQLEAEAAASVHRTCLVRLATERREQPHALAHTRLGAISAVEAGKHAAERRAACDDGGGAVGLRRLGDRSERREAEELDSGVPAARALEQRGHLHKARGAVRQNGG
jgi:hypothetical protein